MSSGNDNRKGVTQVLDKPLSHKQDKVLIVEDDPQLRRLLNGFLTSKNYAVTVCESGEKGLAEIRKSSFKVILSDVMMPGMSGIELLNEAKQIAPRTEFIIMTGYPKVEAAVETIKVGAFDYISKPFELDELEKKISDACAVSKKRSGHGGRTTVIQKYSRKLAGFGIIRTLGEGSMGIVLLAERAVGGEIKKFALKIIKYDCQSKEIVERFFKEAQAAEDIGHPNIIRVFEHGYAREENIPYLAMEFFEGRTLKEIIKGNIKYSLEDKVKIILQVALAAEAAHNHEIIHRDIKPDNIMVNKKGLTKLTDFGIVQLPNSDQTCLHKIIGTPYYLSPESFSRPKVTAQADIYSLGTVAYEFLLGVRPFQSENVSTLGFKVQTTNPPEPVKINKGFPLNLQEILEKSLKKNIANRYPSTTEMVNDLKAVLKDGFTYKKLLQKTHWDTLH